MPSVSFVCERERVVCCSVIALVLNFINGSLVHVLLCVYEGISVCVCVCGLFALHCIQMKVPCISVLCLNDVFSMV